jgi:hypothetical protein
VAEKEAAELETPGSGREANHTSSQEDVDRYIQEACHTSSLEDMDRCIQEAKVHTGGQPH